MSSSRSTEAAHVHHVEFRSHGGADDPSNLISLCAAHHLHAVHLGWVRVAGKAPHRLRWAFRPGGGPAVGSAEGSAVGSPAPGARAA